MIYVIYIYDIKTTLIGEQMIQRRRLRSWVLRVWARLVWCGASARTGTCMRQTWLGSLLGCLAIFVEVFCWRFLWPANGGIGVKHFPDYEFQTSTGWKMLSLNQDGPSLGLWICLSVWPAMWQGAVWFPILLRRRDPSGGMCLLLFSSLYFDLSSSMGLSSLHTFLLHGVYLCWCKLQVQFWI